MDFRDNFGRKSRGLGSDCNYAMICLQQTCSHMLNLTELLVPHWETGTILAPKFQDCCES